MVTADVYVAAALGAVTQNVCALAEQSLSVLHPAGLHVPPEHTLVVDPIDVVELHSTSVSHWTWHCPDTPPHMVSYRHGEAFPGPLDPRRHDPKALHRSRTPRQ